MNRLVIFAGFKKNGIIHDYVISYLNYLSKISNNIIYIADNEPNLKELGKLLPYVSHIECHPHGEYDFGSYKIGFNYAIENNLLSDVDEIVFCNDSCFCINSLETVFNTMKTKECDFWAMTGSNEYEEHLQSYFLLIKKNVFENKVFIDYLNNVKHLDDFVQIVKTFEIPLKKTLENEGFKATTYLPITKKLNPTFYPIKCFKQHDPLVKKKLFSEPYGCRESLLRIMLFICLSNKKAYQEILSFFEIKSIIPTWWKFFVPKVKRFLYRTEVTRSGKKRFRFLTITFFIKKVKTP